jgi:hypothetical protein
VGAENLAPTGIRSTDRPARSESLYRLSYPNPSEIRTVVQVVKLQKLLNLDHHRCEKIKPCVTHNNFIGKIGNVIGVTRTHCEKPRHNVTNNSRAESIWVLGVRSWTVKLETAGRFFFEPGPKIYSPFPQQSLRFFLFAAVQVGNPKKTILR